MSVLKGNGKQPARPLLEISKPYLYPAIRPFEEDNVLVSSVKIRPNPSSTDIIVWSFGRGSVIRTIWRSVLLHTIFAVIVTTLTMLTPFQLILPNVLLLVLGVVLGFVISYRAISGYDRFWMGRTAVSDLVRNIRTLSRLVWLHVPPVTKPLTEAEKKTGHFYRLEAELKGVMKEKRMALDLIEGFAFALKHHIRGEPGIYYEDLYDLIVPLHNENQATQTVGQSSSLPELASNAQPTHSQPERDFCVPHPGDGSVEAHPALPCHGENLPLDILKCLSEWFSVLEDRGTVPGSSLGGMIGAIALLEDTLTTLEKILTTPLPYLYSVHINTVWIYLFFLPFQLVELFGWYSIPGTTIAAFIYLGFLAAGEEIEQPFGYDENDLDLDLFCNENIHPEIEQLKKTPCRNTYFAEDEKPTKAHMQSVAEITAVEFDDA